MYSLQFFDFPEQFSFSSEIVNTILLSLASSTERTGKWIISISILSDEMMRALNKEYRNIDKTTDILSFWYFETGESVTENDVFGELFFSLSKLEIQAQEHGHSQEEEFYRLLIHGILHLEWHDHESDEDYESMWKHELFAIQKLQEKFGILQSET